MRLLRTLFALCAATGVALHPRPAQSQTRTMAQDPSLNNFEHAAGTQTAPPDTLGHVRKVGNGPRSMLLIPGLGFGDSIWNEFMESRKSQYTMYAITLPGFGETAPLAMPPAGSRFADVPWSKSAVRAIEQLLARERIAHVTIVAHWALASQIALQLAIDHPDLVESVVLISGVLKSYYATSPAMLDWSTEQRSKFVQDFGERWFKTVTRRTWDDNNYMSYDYAINPLRGLFLWREAARPTLPVWVRYLLEFYSFDQTPRLKELRTPVLVVQPTFDDPAFFIDAGRNYMRDLCIDSWRDARAADNLIEFVTIPGSRLFIMYDQPAALDNEVERFLRRPPTPRQPRN